MLVSCMCPTFNRPPNHLYLLNEAVESFLRQKLPAGIRAELVILNDTPGQLLTCGAPNVRVFNLDCRLGSLGQKRNMGELVSYGELLLPWDDDDISLPGRIEQAVRYMRLGYSYFNPGGSWYLPPEGLQVGGGYCHNASAYTRAAIRKVGFYPDKSGNEDAVMDGKLRAAFRVNEPISRSDYQYIYRWGVSPRHLSGNADGPKNDPHGPHYHRIGQELIQEGTFTIVPKWNQDYEDLCRSACP